MERQRAQDLKSSMIRHSPLFAPYVLVSNTEACHRVPIIDITHLCAYNSSTEIKTIDKQRHVVACPINHYEKLLCLYGFVRIHQSTLINVHHLRSVIKQEGTSYALLQTGEKLTIARARQAELISLLKTQSINYPSPNNHKNIPNSS
jgi:DNA-binding LytR/AlgR family response regulator